MTIAADRRFVAIFEYPDELSIDKNWQQNKRL